MSKYRRCDCNSGCNVEATLAEIGGKWKGVILYHLTDEQLLENTGKISEWA